MLLFWSILHFTTLKSITKLRRTQNCFYFGPPINCLLESGSAFNPLISGQNSFFGSWFFVCQIQKFFCCESSIKWILSLLVLFVYCFSSTAVKFMSFSLHYLFVCAATSTIWLNIEGVNLSNKLHACSRIKNLVFQKTLNSKILNSISGVWRGIESNCRLFKFDTSVHFCLKIGKCVANDVELYFMEANFAKNIKLSN